MWTLAESQQFGDQKPAVVLQSVMQQRTLEEKLACLQAKVLEKNENTHRKAENLAVAQRSEKIQAWNRVKMELPDEAQWLTKMGAVFGKLESVEVKNLKTEEIFKIR